MRIALGIEYDGTAYYGWQRQKDVISVQEELEKALSIVANHSVRVNCAGRTDAGVHGTGQVIHFDTQAVRNDVAWTLGINANLPKDIAVRWCKHVDDSFHARFSATARRYRYIIYNHVLRPGILNSGLSHYHHLLDADKMHQAGQFIVGTHDFTSFRALHCQANTPVRSIHSLNVTRRADFIIIDIKANAFLHHMVRNIAGSLIEIGQDNQKVDWLMTLLEYKNRARAAATAKPGGLYLVEVDYPSQYEIPRPALGPLFLEM
ncbi:tRNA pseudouridine synthase A [Psychromonas sp. CNPT3]|uniref:tRNA pseudouridine(38-40) synthase TruA n=1 Tax=Psychromonas sp. CNPT3 TaxID=314282 RepID=UPI00006E98E6|nr:tRNA pseudouridine(38-40) synthase TruA [Psychromonas sp. CNPT3]AGH81141.1 tRNA pseudouridine synthase A [Psychromonas sp. CNPT3]